MVTEESMVKTTLKEAFLQSPGPDNVQQGAALWGKGLCMGAADIVPGVSGGTVAFITGIYEELVDAIRSFDLNFVRNLVQLKFAEALSGVHLRFLLCLLLGVVSAIVSMAQLIHYLLAEHPVEIWSLFFGLIAASIYVVGKQIDPMDQATAGCIIIGAIVTYFLVDMIPVSTPETLGFVFLCGAIAICAMILPGISGAFLLLMLGKYEYVTGALKNPFVADNAIIIIVFIAGACVGIVVFSRVLHYLLHRWHAFTIAVLTGFMIGALRKVWPWKETVESTIIRGKEYILRQENVLPDAFTSMVAFDAALMIAGAAVVLLLDRVSRSEKSDAV